MRAGELRHRATIERATEARATDGGVTRTWEAIGKRWISIMPLSGREFFEQQATQSNITHRVHMRWLRGLRPKDRITVADGDGGTRVFNIAHAIDVKERRRTTECLVTEVV